MTNWGFGIRHSIVIRVSDFELGLLRYLSTSSLSRTVTRCCRPGPSST